MGLKVESCAKCTYGQPVPGQALVEVCRDPFPNSLLHNLTGQCLTQTAKMNATGYASLTVDASVFFNTKFEDQMQETLLLNGNVTEEGTDVMVAKSAMVSFTNKAVYLMEGSNWPNKPPRPMPRTRTSPRQIIYADQRVLSSSPYTAATEGRTVLPRDQDVSPSLHRLLIHEVTFCILNLSVIKRLSH
ncbi:ovostatin homolog [Pimephales promelas]|uniref:ovostatin homolog n=1 Tax=Pimephales promelas TaxID=90988 RepID=UPI001955C79E|nr:ovostatin homolog [Pimephales promelas]